MPHADCRWQLLRASIPLSGRSFTVFEVVFPESMKHPKVPTAAPITVIGKSTKLTSSLHLADIRHEYRTVSTRADLASIARPQQRGVLKNILLEQLIVKIKQISVVYFVGKNHRTQPSRDAF